VTALAAQIIGILAPGFFLALIGLAWHHRGPAFPLPFVTTLVLNLAMPALLFHTLVSATMPPAMLWNMALAALAVHLVFAPVAILALRRAGADWRLGVAHVVGNTGNLGLPVCLFAFGEQGLAYAISFFAVQCLLLFSIGEAVYAGRLVIRRLARSPILLAIVAAMVWRWADGPQPVFAMQTLQLLGQLVIPIMLITLGVSLASMRTANLGSSLRWAAVRTALAMGVGFSVAALFGLEGAARGVLVIQTVMPVAVFHFLLAQKHGRDSTAVSGLILVTHLGAVVYLPVVLALVLR